ncbi:MAG: SDR family NAD(P)-dependent oxidoreductase [Acidimicrobiia bacterium]
MKVAVTGGSGVVGKAVIRHLVAAGHDVRALARSTASAAVVEELAARPVAGTVLDGRSLEALVEGCDWVFHVAGVNEMCLIDPSPMWEVNVDGTMHVLEACHRAGVGRLIHTSSAVTIGEEQGTIGTETSRHRGQFQSEYERSKTVAERLVLDRAHDLEVVAVNPSSVQGPGRSSGTGALLLAIARGNLPVLVDTTLSIVDIDDCARGHLLAAERGEPGERYILSGPVITVREGVASMNRILGRHTRPWFLRPRVIEVAAPIAEGLARALGRPPLLCPESARVLLSGHHYSGDKATRELGLDYTSLEETLSRTITWFRQEGFLS